MEKLTGTYGAVSFSIYFKYMVDLAQKKCVPCEGGVPPFKPSEVEKYLKEISPDWGTIEDKRLERKFKFKDFKEAMVFVNKVAIVAEEEQHHPDIKIFYNLVTITLWTHAISGLSENDFIMAAKIDQIGK